MAGPRLSEGRQGYRLLSHRGAGFSIEGNNILHSEISRQVLYHSIHAHTHTHASTHTHRGRQAGRQEARQSLMKLKHR